MRITVAICTWNRCSLLAQTLDQMTRLRVARDIHWELLVVNNNCSDATDDLLESASTRLPIRRLFEPKPGKSHALNLALRKARGDFIVWTDDDVLVEEGWLEGFAATARRYPHATVFGGPIQPLFSVPPDPGLIAAFPSLAKGFCGLDHGVTEGPLPVGLQLWGANMACRKAALGNLTFAEQLGPLESTCRLGEDRDFVDRVRQAGGEIVWSPGMKVWHYVPPSRTSLEYLTKYCAGHGRTAVRKAGIPGGPVIFGAPRWLWRKYLESCAQYACLRLTPFRTACLVHLRWLSYWRGAISECRQMGREQKADVGASPTDVRSGATLQPDLTGRRQSG
jgi:glucosyl-dolichyl phosphate glucuronosyltransferase